MILIYGISRPAYCAFIQEVSVESKETCGLELRYSWPACCAFMHETSVEKVDKFACRLVVSDGLSPQGASQERPSRFRGTGPIGIIVAHRCFVECALQLACRMTALLDAQLRLCLTV